MKKSNTLLSTLQVKTARVFEPLLKPNRYRAAHGGRGSGKSHFFANLLISKGMDTDIRAVCVREIQKSLDQSVKLLLEDKIRTLGVQYRFRVLNSHIEVGETGRILFQGMQNHTAESIKSLEDYEIAWVEEAHSLSQRSMDLLRPTIRKEGSEIWAGWNPTSPTDPIDNYLRGGDIPKSATVVEANYRDNPWFPDVLREEMEFDRDRNPDKYAHIWMGKYRRQSEAQVFKNWKVEEFETPDDARFYFGADWGFSIDPSVLVRCFVEGRTLYVDYEAYQVGCEIDHLAGLFAGNDPLERWANPKKHRGIPGSTKWPIRADSARPETISFLQRQGFNISGAIKGAKSVEEGIEFLQNYDIIVHPRCTHTIDEMSFYSYEIDKMTDEVLPKLADKDNHVIDALRYGVETLRRSMNGPRIT